MKEHPIEIAHSTMDKEVTNCVFKDFTGIPS
jgi:hypothetical protein